MSKSILPFYPKAESGLTLTTRTLESFSKKFHLAPEQILLVTSICADDINNIKFPPNARTMLGPFILGGLDGFPFGGLTALKAAVGHIPDDGALLIFYGPHIGIDGEGNPGKIMRPGQHHASDCCGAANGAMRKVLAQGVQKKDPSALDYQQETLEQILLSKKNLIETSPNPSVTSAEIIYEASRSRLIELLDLVNPACKTVIMMGAIVINGNESDVSFVELRNIDQWFGPGKIEAHSLD